MRIAALYKVEDAIRGSDPDHRRAVRQEMSRPLLDEFFTWLKAQAARVSRKSDLGEAMAYMLKRQDGFRLFLDDGRVDIDSNLVENAIRSPAMNRRNALFAGHDEGASYYTSAYAFIIAWLFDWDRETPGVWRGVRQRLGARCLSEPRPA
ncbi:transposase IS66 family protein [Loktanella sp. PT4BL]|nr:transposase IS66 family protein [Loktanella sp. PT4BL]